MHWKVFLSLILLLHVFASSNRANEAKKIVSMEYDDDEDDINTAFQVGKDRELFYASLDLKWIANLTLSPRFWRNIPTLTSRWFKMKILTTSLNSKKPIFNVLSHIHQINSNYTLSPIDGDFDYAIQLHRKIKKPLLIYVENETVADSSRVYSYRRLLSNPDIGSYISENLLFWIGVTEDTIFSRYLTDQSIFIETYPCFFIVTFGENNISKLTLLNLNNLDLKPHRLQRYLENLFEKVEMHTPSILEK